MKKVILTVSLVLFLSWLNRPVLASSPLPYIRTIVNSGTGGAAGDSVTIDDSYNVYVSGYFYDTVDFGAGGDTGSRTSTSGSYDGYITKYNINGTRIWTKTFGGTGDEEVLSVTHDSSGNIYATGYFGGTVDFGAGGDTASRVSNGSYDVFITKYQSDGTRVWTKTYGGTSDDYGNMIKVDASGNIYVTGSFKNTVDFGAGGDTASRVSNGNSDIFLTKYQSDGTRVWTKTFGGTSADDGTGVSFDSSGNVYSSGDFQLTVDFGAGGDTASRVSNGVQDAFITKYQSDGTRVWTKTFGGTGSEVPYDLEADSSGNVFTTGYFNNTVDFGSGGDTASRVSNGFNDVFITKYLSDGSRSWTKTFGGTDGDNGMKLEIDSSSNVYVSGTFRYVVNFNPDGSNNIDANSTFISMFLTSFDTNGVYQWTRTASGGDESTGGGLAVNQYEIYVSGVVYGTVDFDPQGSGDNKTGDISNGSMMLVKYGNPVPSPTPSPSPTPASSLSPTLPPQTSVYYPPEVVYPPAPYSFPVIYKGEATANSITLTFFPGAGIFTQYGVSYGLTESADSYSAFPLGDSQTKSVTIGALNPDTTYYFVLSPYNGIMPGPPSPTFSLRTAKVGGELVSSVVPFPSILPSPIPSTISPSPSAFEASHNEDNENKPTKEESSTINNIVGQTLGIATVATRVAKEAVDQSIVPVAAVSTGVVSLELAGGIGTLLTSLFRIYSISDRKIYFLLWDLLVGIWQWLQFALATLLYALFGIVVKKKHGNGKVFDSLTGNPLRGAYLIFYSPSGNLSSDFSNAQGEYAVTPRPDRYNLRVDMTGYRFPSLIADSLSSAKYGRLYKNGEEIEVEKVGEVVSQYSIPLDGILPKWRVLAAQVKRILEKPVLIAWSGLSVLAYLNTQNSFYLTIATLSIIFASCQLIKRRKAWVKT